MKALKLRRVVPVLVALSLALVSPLAMAIPSDPEAKAHLDKGNVLFQQGDFEGAAEEYKLGYEAQPDPAFLYTWAQAERRRGRCAAAVKLYQRYIATNPPDVSAEYAREGMLKCAEEMAADEPMPPGDERATDVTDPTDPDGSVVDAPADAPPPKPSDRKKHWSRDPAGATLVALGTVGVGAGIGLLVAGGLEKDKSSANYGEFDERLKRAKNLQIAGGIVLGIGVGVLVGGIARWAVLARREKKVGVSAMIGRSTAGLVFTHRF